MNRYLELNGLNCSNCGEKIKNMSSKIDGVNFADLNFVTKKLTLNIDIDDDYENIKEKIIDIVNRLEPSVEVIELNEHKEHSTKLELELNGLDCTNCAQKIEEMSRDIDGVLSSEMNFITKKFILRLENENVYTEVNRKVLEIISRLEPSVEVINLSNRDIKNLDLNLRLNGLNCMDCANNIEKFTKSIRGVEDSNINFSKSILNIKYRAGMDTEKLVDEIIEIVNTLEPDVVIENIDKIAYTKSSSKSILNNIDKKQMMNVIFSVILFAIPKLFGIDGNLRTFIYLISYLIIGHKIIKQAFINIKSGVPFDENFLMSVATIGAFIIGEYPEAIMVMLLYQIGEILQGVAVNHSRDSITALMDIRPDYANLLVDGKEVLVDPNEVKIGDVIIVKPGERVPLDGIVVDGNSTLDTSSITGESVPRNIVMGEDVVSGVVNIQGLLKIEVLKEFGESTISKILDLVENASSKKAETENFITKFSKYYTPIVVFIAVVLAILPPVLNMGSFSEWFYRSAVFLVISCPCALVISVPLGFFGGLGGASKRGILIKGSNYLEALADIETVVFDKTGTLTEGIFKVSKIKSYGNFTEDDILEIAAYGERYSNHPIAKSIISEFGFEIDEKAISEYEEIAGKGISVKINDKKYLLGNKSLMEDFEVETEDVESIGTVVYIAILNKQIGTIVVSDKIKEGVIDDLKLLKKSGVKQNIMLSGDNTATVKKVSGVLVLDGAYGNLLPQNKVEIFEGILADKTKTGKVAFVGDGVNDAPVLARADVGIAMGGMGSDAAIEASDIVIMTDDIGKISDGIKIGRKTRRIVTQNIVLALGVKFVVLGFGAFGIASMWQAVFADVGVSIIAILNSIRALNTSNL